jgi:hypothetical protein
VGGGSDKKLGFVGDSVTGVDKTCEGGQFTADGTKGVADGITRGGFVKAAGEKVVPVKVKRAFTKAARLMGKVCGKNRKAETSEKAELVVGWGEAIVRILAGKVMKCDGHHGVGEGGNVGAYVGGGGK